MTNAQNATLGATSRGPVLAVQFVVFGQLYSMKNSKIRGRFKHPKARKFEEDFAHQVLPSHKLNLGSEIKPLRALVNVYYPSRRQDLDCALLYDCLQHNGIVSNDRYIVEKHEFAYLDADNPRVEVMVEEK